MDEKQRKLRLYSLSTCPTCKKVRRLLDELGLQFELVEVDLLDSGQQWVKGKELKGYNPRGTYPTLVIEEVVTGYDEKAIKTALGME